MIIYILKSCNLVKFDKVSIVSAGMRQGKKENVNIIDSMLPEKDNLFELGICCWPSTPNLLALLYEVGVSFGV